MRADHAMRYFVELRNEILKQGKLNVTTTVHLVNFSARDIPLESKPPGALGFVIGDSLGGSGWEVELPGGEKIMYYVGVSPLAAVVTQVFQDLPHAKFPGLEGLTVDEMAVSYIEKLTALVERAKHRFSEPPPRNERHGHLRLVKNS